MKRISLALLLALTQWSCTEAKAELVPGGVGTAPTLPSGISSNAIAFHAVQTVNQGSIGAATVDLTNMSDSTGAGFDSGSVFASNLFTAPSTGVYSFQTCVRVNGSNVSDGERLALLLRSGASTSIATGVFFSSAASQDFSGCLSGTFSLTATTTVKVSISTNSADNWTTDSASVFFSGFKVN